MARKPTELAARGLPAVLAAPFPLRRYVPSAWPRWSALIALACGVALVLAVGMDHPLQDDNEGLYAAVAREMLASHSWTVPTLDGVPYLEKPPMLYWLTALSYSVFGVSELSTRAVPVLGLVLSFFAIAWFAWREWGERTAMLAVCIAAASPLFLGMGRMLMFDGLFTGFYTWALVAMYEALVRDAGRRWMLLAAAALAAAVLTKGLVAIVFVGSIGLALALAAPLETRRERLRRLFDPAAIALFAAIAVPWHVLAWRAEPTFGWFYFVNEHFLRFLDLREPHDYYHGPIWYYLPRIFASMLPWSMLALAPARNVDDDPAARRFLWLAFLAPLLFFSLSSAKANYYMVVTLPGAALLLARKIERIGHGLALAAVPLTWIAIFGAAGIAGARLAAPAQWPPGAAMLVQAALLLASASLMLVFARRPLAAMMMSAAVAIPFAALLSDYVKANESTFSGRRMAGEIDARGLDRVFLYRDYEAMSALPFYLGRRVGIIDPNSNELEYGIHLAPDAARFPSLAQFLASRPAQDEAIVVADSRRHEFLATPLASLLRPVYRSGKLVLYVWKEPSAGRIPNPPAPNALSVYRRRPSSDVLRGSRRTMAGAVPALQSLWRPHRVQSSIDIAIQPRDFQIECFAACGHGRPIALTRSPFELFAHRAQIHRAKCASRAFDAVRRLSHLIEIA